MPPGSSAKAPDWGFFIQPFWGDYGQHSQMAANPLGAHQAGPSFRRPRGRACGCVKLRACRVVARLGTLVSDLGLTCIDWARPVVFDQR
ncbi:hypothetical protein E2978_16465 [Paracoccus yeei]